MSKVSLDRQAVAVERVCMGKRAALHIREEANIKAKREVWPEADLHRERELLHDLEAASATLTWLQTNRETVLAAHQALKKDTAA